MATTAKGYPYPIGTDRVMDGDDAIRSLAEAIDGDALYTRAAATGHSITGGASNGVQWDAASPNGCNLTKTSSTVWTATLAGLYVVTAACVTSGFQTVGTRNYCVLVIGADQIRTVWPGENAFSVTAVYPLAVGETINMTVFPNASTSITSGILTVARLGRR